MLMCRFVVSYLNYIAHDKSVSPEFMIDVIEYVSVSDMECIALFVSVLCVSFGCPDAVRWQHVLATHTCLENYCFAKDIVRAASMA